MPAKSQQQAVYWLPSAKDICATMVAVRVSCAVRQEWRPHVDFVEVREGALQYINDTLDVAVADEHRVQRHEGDGPLLMKKSRSAGTITRS